MPFTYERTSAAEPDDVEARAGSPARRRAKSSAHALADAGIGIGIGIGRGTAVPAQRQCEQGAGMAPANQRVAPITFGYRNAELADRIGVPASTLAGWISQIGYRVPDGSGRGGVRPHALTQSASTPVGPDAEVGIATSTDWREDEGNMFRAADVVWFETLARLVHSGVPVARAALLLRATQGLADNARPVARAFPTPTPEVQTESRENSHRRNPLKDFTSLSVSAAERVRSGKPQDGS